MNFFVAVTDYDWFRLHASKVAADEVNFWRSSPGAIFKPAVVPQRTWDR